MDWALSGTDHEILLRQMRTTVDARECRRCHALLRLGQGHSVSAVAREFGVSRQTLYNWYDKFQTDSIPGLTDRARSGRPTVWTDERRAMLQQLLGKSPREHGFFAAGWTTGLLQARLEQLLGWSVSDYSLRQQLHQMDYVWKRYRYKLKPDPLRDKKKTHLQTI
jgi:transposase